MRPQIFPNHAKARKATRSSCSRGFLARFPCRDRTLRAGERSPWGSGARVAVVELPVRAPAPAQRRVHRGARPRRRFEHAQRELEREGLRLRIVRAARAVAERKIAEEETAARRSARRCPSRSHHHGRDSVRFEMARDEADRLVETGQLGARRAASASSSTQRARISDNRRPACAAGCGGWRAMKALRELHPALRRRLPQRRQRKPGAAVLHAGVLAVDRRRARCAGRGRRSCRPSRRLKNLAAAL